MDNVSLLNGISALASQAYQDRIPTAVQTNITTVGNAIVTYPKALDEFITLLPYVIAKTLVRSSDAQNRFVKFKGENIILGAGVQDLTVDPAKGKVYNPDETNDLSITKPVVKQCFHMPDRKMMYDVAIYENELRKCFTLGGDLIDFTSQIVASLNDGKEWDEETFFLEMCGNLCTKANGTKSIIDAKTSTLGDFVLQLKNTADELSERSKDYNRNQAIRRIPQNNLVLLINSKVANNLDINFYAGVYNMGKTEIPVSEIIRVPNFGSYTDTTKKQTPIAQFIDRRGVMWNDYFNAIKNKENIVALYTKYVLHIWSSLSYSLNAPFVALMGANPV